MPERSDHEPERGADSSSGAPEKRVFLYRILRYVPSLLSVAHVNIGVLLYDPNTGERRLRLTEGATELNRLRRLRPPFDEAWLRGLHDHLESRLGSATHSNGNGGPVRSTLRNGHGNPTAGSTDWLLVLEKWDETLSQSLQMSGPKATTAENLNDEIDRLYDEYVAPSPAANPRTHPASPSTRPQMRRYMDQVFRQAGLSSRIEKFVPVSRFTLDENPMLIDYSYALAKNKIRGFIQTISLTRKPDDAEIFSLIAKRVQDMEPEGKMDSSSHFTAVTDIPFEPANRNHRFHEKMLGEHGIVPVPLENFAVWVANLRPTLR